MVWMCRDESNMEAVLKAADEVEKLECISPLTCLFRQHLACLQHVSGKRRAAARSHTLTWDVVWVTNS